jgi:putative N6-adenine-specific DNA methylase
MKGICVGYRGAEPIMQKEVFELINAKAKAEDSVVVFDAEDKDLCKLCYLGQSFTRVLQLLDCFKIKKLSDVKRKIDFSFLKEKKFRIVCERIGEHDFNSTDISRELGEHVFESVKCKVDYKNPEIILYVYIINENCHIGIDYAGFDLSKREYKVYLHPAALRGTIGYIMLRTADYEPNYILLDPFCGSGVIPIEAAYFSSKFPINFFRKDKFQFMKMEIVDPKFFEKLDEKHKIKGKILAFDKELRHINSAKQNAKIGGVEKFINFSRVDVEWLDTKFEKGEVDVIVTDLPFPTKWNLKKIIKIYDEFFYQCEFVLKDKGQIVATVNPELIAAAQKKGFKLANEITIQKKSSHTKIGVFKKEKFK